MPIVAVYLALNVIVVGWGLHELWLHPEAWSNWRAASLAQHGSVSQMVLFSLLLFPKLALGLSGFETGVAVMPLVEGEAGDVPERPMGRIRNTRKLLTTAAVDHERHAARKQHRDDALRSRRRRSSMAARRTAARSRTSPTNISGTRSERCTTSAR